MGKEYSRKIWWLCFGKNSDEITMGEVIRYFEGMIAMISCVSVSSYEPCSQEGNVILEEFFKY